MTTGETAHRAEARALRDRLAPDLSAALRARERVPRAPGHRVAREVRRRPAERVRAVRAACPPGWTFGSAQPGSTVIPARKPHPSERSTARTNSRAPDRRFGS